MSSNNRLDRTISHLANTSAVSAQPVSAASNFSKQPITVAVTGAAGNIAYSLVYMIAEGRMFTEDQPVILHLIDLPQALGAVNGLIMELNDAAFPLLAKVVGTDNYAVGFKDIDVAVLVGAFPRGKGMDRSDLLLKNASIFKGQGEALNQYAKKTAKILVVGNPANTNAYIAMKNAPTLPPENFHALTRLDHNRAVATIAQTLETTPANIRNVVIWGNHSDSMVPDITTAVVTNIPHLGRVTPVTALIDQATWKSKFVEAIAKRGGEIIKHRGKSSAMSAAQASVHHIRDWVLGTRKGEYVSISLPSDGSYGVPKGLIFSFPSICHGGHVQIVKDLPVSDDLKAGIEKNVNELIGEAKMAGVWE